MMGPVHTPHAGYLDGRPHGWPPEAAADYRREHRLLRRRHHAAAGLLGEIWRGWSMQGRQGVFSCVTACSTLVPAALA